MKKHLFFTIAILLITLSSGLVKAEAEVDVEAVFLSEILLDVTPSPLQNPSLRDGAIKNLSIKVMIYGTSIPSICLTAEQREAFAQQAMNRLENSWNSSQEAINHVPVPDLTLEQRDAIAQQAMNRLENSWNSSQEAINYLDNPNPCG